MDRHFRSAPLEANLPVVLALLNLWYTDFFGAQSRAVIPYDQHLEYLPAYLQQLEMESNGKGVTLSGSALDYPSAPLVWGAPGTNGQHAFFQLLHQGTLLIPVDFLVAWHGHHSPEEQHELLVANCIAQSQALMFGRSAAEVEVEMRARGIPETEVERLVPHRVCPGNRPSNTLCYERLTPETLGALIALYEHKTFTEGVILGIDSFDQWGVELGKTLAGEVAAGLRGEIPTEDPDASTRALIERYRRRARDVPEPPSTGWRTRRPGRGAAYPHPSPPPLRRGGDRKLAPPRMGAGGDDGIKINQNVRSDSRHPNSHVEGHPMFFLSFRKGTGTLPPLSACGRGRAGVGVRPILSEPDEAGSDLQNA